MKSQSITRREALRAIGSTAPLAALPVSSLVQIDFGNSEAAAVAHALADEYHRVYDAWKAHFEEREIAAARWADEQREAEAAGDTERLEAIRQIRLQNDAENNEQTRRLYLAQKPLLLFILRLNGRISAHEGFDDLPNEWLGLPPSAMILGNQLYIVICNDECYSFGADLELVIIDIATIPTFGDVQGLASKRDQATNERVAELLESQRRLPEPKKKELLPMDHWEDCYEGDDSSAELKIEHLFMTTGEWRMRREAYSPYWSSYEIGPYTLGYTLRS